MKLVNQFTKLALHYIHSSEGKTVMCPYCYTSQIEPGNILGIDAKELIGTPLYGVRIIETLDDNMIALNIEPNGLPRASGKGFPEYVRRAWLPVNKSLRMLVRIEWVYLPYTKQGGTADFSVPAFLPGFFYAIP